MIEVKDVVKTFDGFRALDGVTMTVPRGAVLFRTTSETGSMISVSTGQPSLSSRSFSTASPARSAPSCRTVVSAGRSISHMGVSSNPATEMSSGTR